MAKNTPVKKEVGKDTRPYVAGKLFAKYGLDMPIKDMVAKLDAAYGDPNPRESAFCLRNARNAIKGFLAAKKAKKAKKAAAAAATEEAVVEVG